MYISHVSIRNFKHFRYLELDLRPGVNIIAGDNNTGKTTLLEAIHLALTGTYRGRQLSESFSPHLFNRAATDAFFAAVHAGEEPALPEISISLTITSNRGSERIRYRLVPDKAYLTLLKERVSDRSCRNIPVQYYISSWEAEGNERVKRHLLKLESCLIDNSDTSETTLLTRLLADNVSQDDILRIRNLRDTLSHFIDTDDSLAELNALLSDDDRETPTESHISIGTSIETDFRWNRLLSIEADGLPVDQSGSGTQKSLALRLAVATGIGKVPSRFVILIEQPEQNLSFSSLQKYISFLAEKFCNSQLVITTLSSYVANKLGLDSVILLSRDSHISLSTLEPDTVDFFHKITGYDTLRFIMAKRTLLVEGDSDELIVQKAYRQMYGRLPDADGIDIQCVRGRTFQRYLKLALPLYKRVGVLTDSDGSPENISRRFKDFIAESDGKISLYTSEKVLSKDDFSGDSLPSSFNYNTLEPFMLHANSTPLFNRIFGTSFIDDNEMLRYMNANKSECALHIYQSKEFLAFPDYILRAVRDLHTSSLPD